MVIQCITFQSNSPLVWLTGCEYGDRSMECLRESCPFYTWSKRRDCCYTCPDDYITPSESTTQRPNASSAPGKTLHLGFDGRQLICCVRTKAQISLRIMQSDECLCCSLYKKNNITLNLLVIPRHFKKCGVLYYTLHSKNCVQVSVRSSSCPSVRLSVCMSVCMPVHPSVRQPIVFTLCREHFLTNFLHTCHES